MKLFYVKVLCEREKHKHRHEIRTLTIYAETADDAIDIALEFVRTKLDLVPEKYKVTPAKPGIVGWDMTSKTPREIADEESHHPYVLLLTREVRT